MTKLASLHPFPARMAPDLALQKIENLTTEHAVVLDPMCGSGTVPGMAVRLGRTAVACDLDPLAVMMTRVACHPSLTHDLVKRAERVLKRAKLESSHLPTWIAGDKETTDFAHYWFAEEQRQDLSRIAKVLAATPSPDALRLALSRVVVTKEGGASLARDTSHSRPHRVRLKNDFDVYEGFLQAAKRLQRLVAQRGESTGHSSIRKVDARKLSFVPRGSVDLTVTSPPYLNAIDYMRGHRLSLVWFGWTLSALREVRGESIGTERSGRASAKGATEVVMAAAPDFEQLPGPDQRMVRRYARDLDRLCHAVSRVTRPGGHFVLVVANSQLRGVSISNSHICKAAALGQGFEFVESVARPLPTQHRYLPPPEKVTGTFASRMREETVLTFARS